MERTRERVFKKNQYLKVISMSRPDWVPIFNSVDWEMRGRPRDGGRRTGRKETQKSVTETTSAAGLRGSEQRNEHGKGGKI